MRSIITIGPALAAMLLSACIGGSGTTAAAGDPVVPALNTVALTVDAGPAGATGAINHAYVTVKVCAPGSQTQCSSIDHVLLDTGSWGLRLVRSVLTAHAVTLNAEVDCAGTSDRGVRELRRRTDLGSGGAGGYLARRRERGEIAGADHGRHGRGRAAAGDLRGQRHSDQRCSGFSANGVLGVGVFAQDCGEACVAAATALPLYYGCTAAGVCTAENVALSAQVTNPVAMFPVDNNGIIVSLPNLQNANGDVSVQGELTFGISTQTDNALPATALAVLGADGTRRFHRDLQWRCDRAAGVDRFGQRLVCVQ